MNGHPGRFVDHQQVSILVEHQVIKVPKAANGGVPVRQMPEAIFIGVTHPHGRSGSDDESAPLQVFYLEAGLDQPMLGEMTADGRHGSRAQTCKPQLEHFVALLDDVLAA